MAGFTFRYRLGGGAPTIRTLKAKNTETITKGDMVNLESGELDLGAAGDTGLYGVALDTGARVDSTTDITFISDEDAVYAVADANARVDGAPLDLAGATGAQGVAAASGKEFVVVAPSSATEETLVRINVGKHPANKAQ